MSDYYAFFPDVLRGVPVPVRPIDGQTAVATFDIKQTDSAVAYIQEHAKSDKPFFMDINFIKMHNPTNAAPEFRGRSHLGDYSDSLMELDADIGRLWMSSVRRRLIQSSS